MSDLKGRERISDEELTMIEESYREMRYSETSHPLRLARELRELRAKEKQLVEQAITKDETLHELSTTMERYENQMQQLRAQLAAPAGYWKCNECGKQTPHVALPQPIEAIKELRDIEMDALRAELAEAQPDGQHSNKVTTLPAFKDGNPASGFRALFEQSERDKSSLRAERDKLAGALRYIAQDRPDRKQFPHRDISLVRRDAARAALRELEAK